MPFGQRDISPDPDDFDEAREDTLALWRSLEVAMGRQPHEGDGRARFDRAQSQRLDLAGRYQLADANEFICRIPEISPRGLRIDGPWPATPGQRGAVNIAAVGIVEGVVVEAAHSSFVLAIVASPRRIRKLSQRLAWQIRRAAEALAERRSSERVEMRHKPARLETTQGKTYECQIFDLSEGGAALHLGADALYFWVEQPIRLDGRCGAVLRHFPGGLVVKFD
jgi:hypothetical protein